MATEPAGAHRAPRKVLGLRTQPRSAPPRATCLERCDPLRLGMDPTRECRCDTALATRANPNASANASRPGQTTVCLPDSLGAAIERACDTLGTARSTLLRHPVKSGREAEDDTLRSRAKHPKAAVRSSGPSDGTSQARLRLTSFPPVAHRSVRTCWGLPVTRTANQDRRDIQSATQDRGRRRREASHLRNGSRDDCGRCPMTASTAPLVHRHSTIFGEMR